MKYLQVIAREGNANDWRGLFKGGKKNNKMGAQG